eukprot:scpid106627/ scgid20326/ 
MLLHSTPVTAISLPRAELTEPLRDLSIITGGLLHESYLRNVSHYIPTQVQQESCTARHSIGHHPLCALLSHNNTTRAASKASILVRVIFKRICNDCRARSGGDKSLMNLPDKRAKYFARSRGCQLLPCDEHTRTHMP